MNVHITGGTGFVGSHLSNTLADRDGVSVTVLSRNPSESPVPIDDSVDRRSVDVSDNTRKLDFSDADVVVHLVALSPLFKPKGTTHEEVHVGGTRNVVEACERDDVERLVHMSALGADPEGDTAYIRTKGEAEGVVKDSSLDSVIFRPSVVFGEGGEFVSFTKRLKKLFAPGLPIYPLPGGGKNTFQPIWVGDLAEMLADAAVEEDHVGDIYEVGGSEVLSLAEMSKMIYRSEGKPIKVVPVPIPLAKLGMSAMDPMPFIPFGKDQYRSLKIDNIVKGRNSVDVFGYSSNELRTFGEYLGIDET
ncbi:MAG: complex I NDUFA9 subunit family protein [Halobacteria archaeon]|nr:complex I NDUFA9 subunit family protein [Halobacteria archaeon]